MKSKSVTAVIAMLLIAAFLPVHTETPGTILVWKVIVPPLKAANVRTCPLCGASLPNARVERDGNLVMKRLLREELKTLKECKFHFLAKVPGASENGKKDRVEKMIAVAKQKGAGGLLVPVLLRYRELVGNKYAASSPASVAFHLHLIRVEDSKAVWDFAYVETQRPLSENLLDAKKFWKRRFKWVKVERLLIEGIEKAMRDFPKCEGEAP